MISRRIICKGRVQGVFYRASTKEKADTLGLSGWVRNLPNGDVEILACGSQEKVDQLIKWCWDGPPASQVTHVIISEEEDSIQGSFQVKYF